MTGRPLRPSLAGRWLGLLAALVMAVPIVVAVLLLTEFNVLIDRDEAADGAAAVEGEGAALSASTTEGALGSADTPEADAEPAAAAPEEPEPDAEEPTHVVVPGDTLAAIAVRFGTSVRALAAFNAIENVDALRVGQAIRIPPEDYEPPAPEPEPDPDADPEPGTEPDAEPAHEPETGPAGGTAESAPGG